MNHTIELPGLREDMARDFLAAVGLLRLIDLKWPQLNPKLSWMPDSGYPRIHLDAALPIDWCQQIVSDIKSLEIDPLTPLFHGEIIKAEYQIFRDAITKAVRFKGTDHPFAALPEIMFAAYAGQMPDPKTGMVEPTMLSFANGQSGKSLLRDVKELIRTEDAADALASLKGMGKPSIGKSFRWAPQEYRPAALRAHDPGSKVKGDEPLDYPTFNILAFFGLSCVPTISGAKGCVTAAFEHDAFGWSFRWPVWAHPISVSEVVSILCLNETSVATIPGVKHIWKSRRLVAEKSVYFSPAILA